MPDASTGVADPRCGKWPTHSWERARASSIRSAQRPPEARRVILEVGHRAHRCRPHEILGTVNPHDRTSAGFDPALAKMFA